MSSLSVCRNVQLSKHRVPAVRKLLSKASLLLFIMPGCGEEEPTVDSKGAPGAESGAPNAGDTSGAAGAGMPALAGAGAASGETRTVAPTYLKASNANAQDFFGVSLALSADGTTLAVGANGESSSAQGIGGDEADNSAESAGAVYLFSNTEGNWRQVHYFKASNAGAEDGFGSAVVLSADGSTLAVGAPAESSSALGVDGDRTNDSVSNSGAVYVFANTGSSWTQQAFIKASKTDEDDLFGISVALSANGNVLAVGAEAEDGGDSGVDGNETDKSVPEAGAVYVFSRQGETWTQQSYIKASNPDPRDHFGGTVSLSGDGSTLAVGAYWEDSVALGVNGDQTDNSASGTGAAYVFTQDGASWTQQVYLKPQQNNGTGRDGFGVALRLSADGSTLAVGAAGDAGEGKGIDSSRGSNMAPYSGAAYLFSREAAEWNQEAYVKASNASKNAEFGRHLALSQDGRLLAIGAALEASAPTGANGNAITESGTVYVFRESDSGWIQQPYVKAPYPDVGDRFGWSVALAGETNLVAVGALLEDSSHTGVNGEQADNGAPSAGAAYLFGALIELNRE